MELFIPSVLVLLLAAAVIFFVLPRFGAPVLAIISVGLLVYGLYEHMNAFQTEYRLSTWQAGLITYAPYVMVGGLLVVIAFYLLSISPWGKPSSTAPPMPEVPTIAEMPKAETATNMVTAGVNNALKGAKNALGNAAAAVGLGNAAKNANNKGLANEAAKAANGVKNAAEGLANRMRSAFSTFTGNNNNNNNRGNNNTNNRPRIPGINFPLSQV
jgi:hypothetical protein